MECSMDSVANDDPDAAVGLRMLGSIGRLFPY